MKQLSWCNDYRWLPPLVLEKINLPVAKDFEHGNNRTDK
jgi:hypothetical protein